MISNRLPIYDANLFSLTFSYSCPQIYSYINFLNHYFDFLKSSPPNLVNNIFFDFIHNPFLLFTLIFTDHSVSPLLARYSFYIPEFHISFSSNLPLTASSYTAECFAIIEVLQSIYSLSPNKFLIATDSLSYLQALSSNIFKSLPSPPIMKIRLLLFTLSNSGFDIQFLWIPGHTGIAVNEFSDNLAKSTTSFRCPSNRRIYFSFINRLILVLTLEFV